MAQPVLQAGGAVVTYEPRFLAAPIAEALFAALVAELPLRVEDVVLFGRRIPQPRLSLWMGDASASYRYSGVTRQPAPWHPLVRDLAERASAACGECFNSVLVNLYRDGRDSMGFHADDEPELGPAPVIASLSLGAARTFVVRAKKTRASGPGRAPLLRLALEPGSLLVMSGATQRETVHGVPKEPLVAAPRLNLTFRRILDRR